MIAGLAAQGLAASTRLGCAVIKGFHAFLLACKAAEIEAAFGSGWSNPVAEFNAPRQAGADSPAAMAPPDSERMEQFVDFLKTGIASARKYAAAGRDYALLHTSYMASCVPRGLALDRSDVHFGRGPLGKLHVRLGKSAKTSGPRRAACRGWMACT